MKIFEVSDFHSTGGASIAASRIASALELAGNSVFRLSSDSKDPEGALFLGKKAGLLLQLLAYLRINFFQTGIVKHETLRQFRIHLLRQQPDHILFHNIHGTNWPLDMIDIALEFAPTTWILHDCWSFSGRFYPSNSPKADKKVLQSLKHFWNRIPKSRLPLSAVTPSSWMQTEATRSNWSGMNVETIHNPIPNNFSNKIDKTSAKNALGLNPAKKVVLCIAGNLTENRKGGSILKEILSSEQTNCYQFLLIGNSINTTNNSEKVLELGFLNDEIALRLAYNAADLTLHTAPVDNLPNTVAESMSCGTPVISFEVGGLPEMIKDNECGWLVQKITAEAMIYRLQSLSKNQNLRIMGSNARKRAKYLFSEEKIAQKYNAHFNSLVVLSENRLRKTHSN